MLCKPLFILHKTVIAQDCAAANTCGQCYATAGCAWCSSPDFIVSISTINIIIIVTIITQLILLKQCLECH